MLQELLSIGKSDFDIAFHYISIVILYGFFLFSFWQKFFKCSMTDLVYRNVFIVCLCPCSDDKWMEYEQETYHGAKNSINITSLSFVN